MELISFFKEVAKRKKLVWLWVGSVLLITLALTFAQPLKYGTTSQLLIVQNFSAGVDPYTVSRSNEYLSNTLARVVSSNSFFNETMNSGFNLDKSYFTDNQKQQTKIWQKTVVARSLGDAGIIEIEVYHEDRYQAEQLAQAVNYTLRSKNNLYHGLGNELAVRVLDQPLVSTWPVKPNIPMNTILGLVLGVIAGLTHVYGLAIGAITPRKKKIKESKIIIEREESPMAIPTMVQEVMVNEPSVNIPFANEPLMSVASEQPEKNEQQESFANSEIGSDDNDFLAQGDIKNVF